MDRRSTLPLAVAAALCIAAAPPINAVSASIAEHGAKASVDALVSAHRWDDVLGAIDAGRGDWIVLAPSLALGTDAANAEALTIALATALPKNPAAVLAVVDQGDNPVLGLKRVCGAPFIEDTVDVANYRARAIKALARVADTPLRAECLTALKPR